MPVLATAGRDVRIQGTHSHCFITRTQRLSTLTDREKPSSLYQVIIQALLANSWQRIEAVAPYYGAM
jgi:hypothetical protein